jgi:hypothetical protein
MKESEFWSQNVRKALPSPFEPRILGAHPMFLQRIENSSGRGQGDVNAGYMGREVWIELKVMRGNQIEIRFSQFEWARERIKSGLTNMFVMARHHNLVKVWRYEDIIAWLSDAHSVAKGRLTKKSVVFVPPAPGVSAPVDRPWTTIREYIFGNS